MSKIMDEEKVNKHFMDTQYEWYSCPYCKGSIYLFSPPGGDGEVTLGNDGVYFNFICNKCDKEFEVLASVQFLSAHEIPEEQRRY